MIIELAVSLVISTTNIKEVQNVNLGNNSNNHSFILGDSLVGRLEREQEAMAEVEKKRRYVLVREKTTRTSGESSYTGQGRDIKIVGTSYEQCVIYFKRVTGISRSLGYAGRIASQGNQATIGSGALEKGHISLVIADYGDSIRVRESNYIRGAITERTIPKSRIRGYLYF